MIIGDVGMGVCNVGLGAIDVGMGVCGPNVNFPDVGGVDVVLSRLYALWMWAVWRW